MVNAANVSMFVAVLFSVLPAMGLMYVMLDRFEGFFDEKRVFKFLVVGLILGAVVVLVELLLLRFHDPGRLIGTPVMVGLPLLAVGYPLLESVAKTAALNWHTVAGRPDAPYYGSALGIGFGAILTFITVGRGVRAFLLAPVPGVTHLEIGVFFTLLFLLFLGGIMAHAASGAVIGRFTGDADPLRALGYGTAILVPFYIGYYVVYTAPPSRLGGLTILVPLAVVLYGVVMLRYVRRLMDRIVPEDLAKQVRRDMRRRRRGVE